MLSTNGRKISQIASLKCVETFCNVFKENLLLGRVISSYDLSKLPINAPVLSVSIVSYKT